MNGPLACLVIAAALLSACGTAVKQTRDDIEQGQSKSEQVFSRPLQLASLSRVSEVRGKLIPVTAITNIKTNDWLKKVQVELKIDHPTPLSAISVKLADQGLNIVSDLPLDNYTYTGRVNRTDADAALKIVLGSVGLDFQADDTRKVVMVKPMAGRSWFLHIGNRKSSYSSDGSMQSASSTSVASQAASAAGTSGSSGVSAASAPTGMSGSIGAAAVGTTGPRGQGISPASSSGTTVASADDFWASLSNELKGRLSILVPRASAASRPNPTSTAMPAGMPPMPQPVDSAMQQQIVSTAGWSGDQTYVSRQIGSYALNPETGAISVQAPHWVLNDLDDYIKGIQEMYNTDLTFTGEVVLVTAHRSDSEGFDLSAFASWASGKYAAVIANNVLGGITVSLPSGGAPSVVAGSQAVAGPLMGVQYSGTQNAMQIFNAFLSQIGDVSVIQRPLITTTSGVPGVFSKKFTDYYNTVSQQAAAGGTGSAATATTNTLVPVDLGTELRINPRIDISTGLIRAQLTLNQAIQSGTKNVPQTITVGNSTSTINSSIPLVTRQDIAGEILLRDGDLIVVGGQREQSLSADENGLPGNDGPMGGIFGAKTSRRGAQTYYFALRVSVSKRK